MAKLCYRLCLCLVLQSPGRAQIACFGKTDWRMGEWRMPDDKPQSPPLRLLASVLKNSFVSDVCWFLFRGAAAERVESIAHCCWVWLDEQW